MGRVINAFDSRLHDELRWKVFGRKRWPFKILSAAISVLIFSSSFGVAGACLRGVNLAGAEFGGYTGKYGTAYVYPSEETLDWVAKLNMTAIRLPFRWERLQANLFGELDASELSRLRETVDYATIRGLHVVLDVHNFGSYKGAKIGSNQVPSLAFVNFWTQLASEFANEEKVVFGLMNEPVGITAESWFASVQLTISSIRKLGISNLVLVPGTKWTGASHWFDFQPGGSNAEVFSGFHDSFNNFAFEFHQYLDEDFSGRNTQCLRTVDALVALRKVTAWMKLHEFRGFLGEFGGTASLDCIEGLTKVTSLVNARDDVWIGWTAWAAGEWWGETKLSLHPKNGREKPQIKMLKNKFQNEFGSIAVCRSLL